jgi:hypothetical protein
MRKGGKRSIRGRQIERRDVKGGRMGVYFLFVVILTSNVRIMENTQ